MRAVIVGNFVADLIAKPIHGFPEVGRLEMIRHLEMHSGGCAVNTSNALGKLGVPVEVIGKVGEDALGDFLIADLRRNGVAADRVARSSTVMTSASFVAVSESGERTFFHFIGANGDLRLSDIDLAVLEGADVLHVAGANLMPAFDGQPTAELLAAAQERGVRTSLDTCWDPTGRWLELVEPALPHLDFFLPSVAEARKISGEEEPSRIAAFALARGVKALGLKLGDEGCYLRSRDVEVTIPPFQVVAQDATGAGDSWVAGFLTGILHGWDLAEVGRFANAVGAMCVTRIGATTGIGTIAETQDFMRRTPIVAR